MHARALLGRRGEDAACEHLRALGFTILARNYRCPAGEMDIVARRGSLIVFCEVKTRRSLNYGYPVEAVDARKQARLRRIAAHYLAAERPQAAEVRFDVVSAIVSNRGVELEHLEDAF